MTGPNSSNTSAPTVSPVWLVLIGIASVQLAPTPIVWLRLATSVLVLVAVLRPRVRGRSREDWAVVLAFGLSLGLMNWAIYQSFARIPLGVAVTIEFIGPLALAVLGSRRPRDLLWVVLAGAGVLLLGFDGDHLDAAGVGFALLAACILLSARTGQRWQGLDGLAVASVVATVLLTPLAIGIGGSDLVDPRVLLVGAAVGVLSSVIPYSCELVALRTLSPGVFGILMSLEPAAAALAGIVVLGELLGPVQYAAVACVVLASIGATRSRRPAVPVVD